MGQAGGKEGRRKQHGTRTPKLFLSVKPELFWTKTGQEGWAMPAGGGRGSSNDYNPKNAQSGLKRKLTPTNTES